MGFMTCDVNKNKGKIPDGMSFNITDTWRGKKKSNWQAQTDIVSESYSHKITHFESFKYSVNANN